MNRREFVTASAFLAQRRGARRAPAPEARWRFSLDGLGRWSLARGGVVAVHGAEISVEIGGAPPVALSRLENARRIRTGSRRSGESTWTFVGRYQDLEVSAEFEDDERPSVTVRVRGLEQPHDLVAVHLTGGVSLSQRSAWINGYQVVRGGTRLDFDDATVRETLRREVVDLEISLGVGSATARAYGCDLTKGYIDENAAYYSS